MYFDYLKDIVEYYRAGVRNASVPQRLMLPTPGSIKDECSAVCKARFDKKDLRMLTAFFESENDRDKILRAIDRCDRDRFKPLVNFLKGSTSSTDDLNIELLAWLIDFPNRPFKAEGYTKMRLETLDGSRSNEARQEMEVEQTAKDDLTLNNKKQREDETELDDIQKGNPSNSKRVIIGLFILLSIFGALWGFRHVFQPTAVNANNDPGKSAKQTENQISPARKENDSMATENGKIDPSKHMAHAGAFPQKENDGKDMVTVSEYINQVIPKSDIAVLVINQAGSMVLPLASDIADMYSINRSYSTATSLFLPKFSTSPYMERLYQGDANLIDILNLQSHADYIVIGKYASDFTSGDFTKYVCTTTLDIVIISCRTKQIHSAFSLVASNPYDDIKRAEKGAKEKLLQDYKINHLSL